MSHQSTVHISSSTNTHHWQPHPFSCFCSERWKTMVTTHCWNDRDKTKASKTIQGSLVFNMLSSPFESSLPSSVTITLVKSHCGDRAHTYKEAQTTHSLLHTRLLWLLLVCDLVNRWVWKLKDSHIRVQNGPTLVKTYATCSSWTNTPTANMTHSSPLPCFFLLMSHERGRARVRERSHACLWPSAATQRMLPRLILPSLPSFRPCVSLSYSLDMQPFLSSPPFKILHSVGFQCQPISPLRVSSFCSCSSNPKHNLLPSILSPRPSLTPYFAFILTMYLM